MVYLAAKYQIRDLFVLLLLLVLVVSLGAYVPFAYYQMHAKY